MRSISTPRRRATPRRAQSFPGQSEGYRSPGVRDRSSEGPLARRPTHPDLEYESHTLETDRWGRTTAVVTLSREGALWRGTARGVASRSRLQLMAEATVDAISQLPDIGSGRTQSLSLHGVKEVSALGRCYVLVAVHAVRDREAVASAGASAVEDSREAAAIAATLQATGRWTRSWE